MRREHKFWRVPVETGFGFFLSLSVFLLLDKTGMGAMCISAALLHELGHLIAMALFRVRLVRVRLRTLEIGIERQEARSLMSEMCIDLAGPAVNLLLAAAAYCCGSIGFSAVNCALGLFELCPLPVLDGGQALSALCQRAFSLERAQKICAAVNLCTLLLILAGGVLLILQDQNFSLLLLLAALALALCPAKKKK